jgi:hypothetical protein
MSNASRLVNKHHAKGYVSRNEKNEKRGACDVKITPKGSAFLKPINKQHNFLPCIVGGDRA